MNGNDDIRYPIGSFEPVADPTPEERRETIRQVQGLAGMLRRLLADLGPDRLEVPYRPGGWTIRQIVHHLADNDLNAYIRFKRALTEEEPLASSYRQDLWAELADYRSVPPEHALQLMEPLHRRFHVLLTTLAPDVWARRLRTEALGAITLDVALQRFVWHHRHHRAQIESLIERMGWRE